MFGRKKKPKGGNLTRVSHIDASASFDMSGAWDFPANGWADEPDTGSALSDLRLANAARGLEPRLKGESFRFPVGPDGKTWSFDFHQRCQYISGNHPSNYQCVWTHSQSLHRPLFGSESLTSHLLEAREQLQEDYLRHLLAVHSPALVEARYEEMGENIKNGGCLLRPKVPTYEEVAAAQREALGLPAEPEREKECSYCGLTAEDVYHFPCLLKAKEEGVDSIYPPTEEWTRRAIGAMNAELASDLARQQDSLTAVFPGDPHTATVGLTTDGQGGFYLAQPDGSTRQVPPETVKQRPDGTYEFVLEAEIFPNGRRFPGSKGVVSQEIGVNVIGDKSPFYGKPKRSWEPKGKPHVPRQNRGRRKRRG